MRSGRQRPEMCAAAWRLARRRAAAGRLAHSCGVAERLARPRAAAGRPAHRHWAIRRFSAKRLRLESQAPATGQLTDALIENPNPEQKYSGLNCGPNESCDWRHEAYGALKALVEEIPAGSQGGWPVSQGLARTCCRNPSIRGL